MAGEVIAPLGRHEPLLLFVQLFLLLVVARTLGERIVDREADLGREFGVEVQTRVIVSDRDPAEEILNLASENDDDLIILGSNLRPLSGRAFFGHRVETIVKRADRPVAVLSSV